MSSTTIYYVYFYLRSKDSQNGKSGTPFYIGKGSNRRAWVTHYNVHKPRNKNDILIVENNLTELQAFMWERYYIRWFGRLDLGTGILRNRTDGGEGGSGDSEETRMKKSRPGSLNGMYGKTHTERVKKISSEIAIKNFKGKSYEELYGKEKSDYLKQLRSENFKNVDHTGKNNARYDFTIYKFFNTETQEIFEGERFEFIKKYNLNKCSVCELLKGNCKTHKKWVLSNNKTNYFPIRRSQKGLLNPRADHSIYQFKNIISNETYIGTRYDFIISNNIDSRRVSEIISGKLKQHKNWILLEKIS